MIEAEKNPLLVKIIRLHLEGQHDAALDTAEQQLRELDADERASLDDRCQIRQLISTLFGMRQQHDQALIYAQGCVALRKAEGGVALAEALLAVAQVYASMSNAVEALAYRDQAKAIYESANETASSGYAELLTDYAQSNRYEDPAAYLDYQKKASNVFEELLPESADRYLMVVNDLISNLLFELNQKKAGYALYKKTMRLIKKCIGKKSTVYIDALSMFYEYEPKLKKRIVLLEQCLALNEPLQHLDHMVLASTHARLVDLYSEYKKFARAEQHALMNIHINEQEYGKGHPETFAYSASLANVYAAQKSYDQAQSVYRAIIEAAENYEGSSPEDANYYRQQLVQMYALKDDLVTAERLALENVDAYTRTSNELLKEKRIEHVRDLSQIYIRMGAWAKAEPLLIELVEVHGLSDCRYRYLLEQLIDVYKELGKVDEAGPLQQALDAADAVRAENTDLNSHDTFMASVSEFNQQQHDYSMQEIQDQIDAGELKEALKIAEQKLMLPFDVIGDNNFTNRIALCEKMKWLYEELGKPKRVEQMQATIDDLRSQAGA